jgi:hypothetical protein
MQETIHKARTYTIMPGNSDSLPSYKKRQNHFKLQEDFNNFVKGIDCDNIVIKSNREKSAKITT